MVCAYFTHVHVGRWASEMRNRHNRSRLLAAIEASTSTSFGCTCISWLETLAWWLAICLSGSRAFLLVLVAVV